MKKPLTAKERYTKILSEIEIFKAAVKEHDGLVVHEEVHWKISRAVSEGLKAKLEELQDEAILYEKKHGL
jgi:hypothetical protein|tara:strand:+ start:174 stop:383 length:210 start_codon:yes stop_codon:yes gene_type:complete